MGKALDAAMLENKHVAYPGMCNSTYQGSEALFIYWDDDTGYMVRFKGRSLPLAKAVERFIMPYDRMMVREDWFVVK